MGNIQMVQSKRKPIFFKKQNLFKSSLSPYNQKFYVPPQTIKSVIKNAPKTDRSYTPITERMQKPFQQIQHYKVAKNSMYTPSKQKLALTPKTMGRSLVQERDQRTERKYYNENRPFGYESKCMYQENKTKCEEIIKKVRNFNDFLNEIKKRMKFEEENSHSFIQSRMRSSQRNESKSISLLLKLENEKMELEKYKRLVERELSKQHSIESISIENKNQHEKILKINYDNQASPKQSRTQHIKEKYKEMVKKVQELGDLIDSEEMKKKRIDNINGLLSKIEAMQEEQIRQQKNIESLLNENDSDDD